MDKYHNSNKESSRKTIFRVLRQIAYTKLFKKYTSGNFSYHKILANNLIYNDSCRIVARFKDFLIFDDNTEFLRRFYTSEESHPRLDRILTFYEAYSKIFPNYMILKESKYLYRNIRKKQKMIDAVNEIKREEQKNREKMKQNNGEINKEINELFTKKVKEEIKAFQENTTFEKHKNQFDSDEEENENSISISIMNKKMFVENIENKLGDGESNPSDAGGEKSNSIYESFVANETNHSISGILNILNDNKIYIKDLPHLLEINNYSKNSKKLKNNHKNINKGKVKKQSPEKQNNKNDNNYNQLISSHSKLEKLNKKGKKYEISKKQSHNKNMANANRVSENYLLNKEFRKTSTPSLSSGTVFVTTNTEKNLNDINQFQNIIIPKVNTVININNNYFEQIDSGSLPLGYCTNKNFKTNTLNDNKNYTNANSIFKKSNTNNYKNTKSNNLLMSEKKGQQIRPFKKNLNDEQIINNLNSKKHHYKQISQDYVYQKNKNTETFSDKKEKCMTNNKNEIQEIKEKIIKFGSLSPQPTINHVETYQSEIKKINQIKKNIKKEKKTFKKHFTENNDPNLITGDTKGNEEDEDDNKEREKLLFHIRDLIESKKKEINTNSNIKIEKENKDLLSNKLKMKIEETKFNLNNFYKYKTISNFSQEKLNEKKKDIESNLEERNFSNKEIINMANTNATNMINENTFSKKIFKTINKEKEKEKEKENKNKNAETNKKAKLGNQFGFKKLTLKEKKNKTKVILKNNTNNNYIATSQLNKEKNKKYLRKTNNKFKKSKYIFNSTNLNQTSLKFTDSNYKIAKKNKLLKERNNQTIKDNKTILGKPSEKSTTTLSHSILYRSPNSQLTNLIKSQKKEDPCLCESNTTTKIYYKGKIKNMKNKKDKLNFETLTQNSNINSSFNNNFNNFYNENLGNKIILTENNNNTNNKNNDANINNNNSKTNKGLIRTHNINNSDLRNKYKSFLLKKNKQKSCELENQSAIQQKMNKELLKRMNLIKQNNKNNFYQKYKENKVKLRDIKSYNGTNFGSFDNLSNSNSIANSLGNTQNYGRNSIQVENCIFQTPSTENKKLGLYKKIISHKPNTIKTEKKKLGQIKGKNIDTPSTIKVNRSKFFGKVKDKFYDNNKMITMTNFNSCLSHKNF